MITAELGAASVSAFRDVHGGDCRLYGPATPSSFRARCAPLGSAESRRTVSLMLILHFVARKVALSPFIVFPC